jgi:hypothetical protein
VVGLHINSLIRLHGVVLNQLSTGKISLFFTLIYMVTLSANLVPIRGRNVLLRLIISTVLGGLSSVESDYCWKQNEVQK